jgi:hypothetical protein
MNEITRNKLHFHDRDLREQPGTQKHGVNSKLLIKACVSRRNKMACTAYLCSSRTNLVEHGLRKDNMQW